jgi:hypothetical protein
MWRWQVIRGHVTESQPMTWTPDPASPGTVKFTASMMVRPGGYESFQSWGPGLRFAAVPTKARSLGHTHTLIPQTIMSRMQLTLNNDFTCYCSCMTMLADDMHYVSSDWNRVVRSCEQLPHVSAPSPPPWSQLKQRHQSVLSRHCGRTGGAGAGLERTFSGAGGAGAELESSYSGPAPSLGLVPGGGEW